MANIITLDPKVGRFEKALARWRRITKLPAENQNFQVWVILNLRWLLPALFHTRACRCLTM